MDLTPFVASQLNSLIEDIRLLEFLVTSPLGLYSDIKMLRESLALPGAEELDREETIRRRTALVGLVKDPASLALDTVASMRSTLKALEALKGQGGSPLEDRWVERAERVLDRVVQKVGADLRAQRSRRIRGLYVIVDPTATGGRPVEEVAEAVLQGGARVLQLRHKEADKGPLLDLARRLAQMCREHDAVFIVNDHADLAALCGAEGLHVGQTDLPVPEARRVLEIRQIVGRSNNSLQEAMDSQAQGADYLAVGAIFPTSTMGKGQRRAVGPELVSQVRQRTDLPVVAIGGINRQNVAQVVEAGAHCVCVVSAVTLAPDPREAAARMVEAIERAGG